MTHLRVFFSANLNPGSAENNCARVSDGRFEPPWVLTEGPVLAMAFPREVCDLQRKDVNFDLIKVRIISSCSGSAKG